MNYFKGKRITLMGLGLLGRGVGDAKFLAEQGADLVVTDLKSEDELAPSLAELKVYDISYTLGGHKEEDFKGRDMIIKAAGVPLDSPYIEVARKDGADIEMSTALFVKLLQEGKKNVITIGVTGTRGKSTVTELIYSILKKDGRNVYLGGNVKNLATLPLIEKVKDGDMIVLELDSWQLQGFAEDNLPAPQGTSPARAVRAGGRQAGISPHIAVFTNFYPDHLNYYLRTSEGNDGTSSVISERGTEASSAYEQAMDEYWQDKTQIFQYQGAGDYLIAGSVVAERISDEFPDYPGNLIVPDPKTLPDDWNIQIPGEHNRENIALAASAAYALDVSDEAIKSAVENFTGLPERIELLREVAGVEYYNDNKSTTPEATLAALRTLQPITYNLQPKIILIIGGSDKGLDMNELVTALPKYCKGIVLFAGEGTERIKEAVYALKGMEVKEGNTLKEVVREASELAQQGDIVLYSPAFTSFGAHFKNVYDRGEQFRAVVDAL